MSADEGKSAAEPEETHRVLNPVERLSEVIFGIIMALSIVGFVSAASGGENDVKTLLWAALGCNTAWGIVDGVMYVLTNLILRGRSLALLHQVRRTAEPERARRVIAGALPPLVASLLEPAALERLRAGLVALPEPPARARPTGRDLLGAVGVFLWSFASTLPVILPFVLVKDAALAIRLCRWIALAMLFLVGLTLGRYSGHRPLATGVVMAAIGGVLVVTTVALGG